MTKEEIADQIYFYERIRDYQHWSYFCLKWWKIGMIHLWISKGINVVYNPETRDAMIVTDTP